MNFDLADGPITPEREAELTALRKQALAKSAAFNRTWHGRWYRFICAVNRAYAAFFDRDTGY